MTKRILAIILMLGLGIALFTGCAAGDPGAAEPAPTAEAHAHVPSGEWEADGKEHWQVCECGERIEAGAHALDDMMLCTACGAEIWDFGDMLDVHIFNEHGDAIRIASYDADGNVLSEMGYTYEYDGEGNKLLEQYYEGGVLLSESEYVPAEGGGTRLFQIIDYQQGSGWFVNEYDEEGQLVRYSFHDDIGAKLTEILYEYAQNAEGEYYTLRETNMDFETGVKYVSEYNGFEDQTGLLEYDAADNLIRTLRIEREYNEEAQPLWEKTYENDVLVNEITGYATVTDEYGWRRFPVAVIDYYEDGGKMVAEYDVETGDLAAETQYGPDGKVVNESRYVYEYDEAGNYASIEVYENGSLVSRTEYTTDENGGSCLSKVAEYDVDENIVSEIWFDEEGNAIS